MNMKLNFVASATALVMGSVNTSHALQGGAWVKAPGNGVVVSSPEGKHGSLVVCRADYDNGQHPGKVWDGTCNFGWGGRTIYSATYEVLVDKRYSWVTARVGGMPANAVDGGDAGNSAGHTRLGVCEVFNGKDGSWHPGKYYDGKCNYAWGGSKTDQFGREIAERPNGNVRVLVGN